MSDGYAHTTSLVFRVNALGAAHAMDLALDAGGDQIFTTPAPEWDEEDILPAPADHDTFARSELAGYEIILIRRAYSTTPGGSSYSADYAVASCSHPMPTYDQPDIQDQSDEYQAELARISLDCSTVEVGKKTASPRL